MKKVTSTLTTLLLCLYVSAQVGALDGGFNTTGYITNNQFAGGDDYATAVATHSDGRVVVAAFNTDKWFTLLRYLPDGTLDPAFGTGGVAKVRFDPDDDAVAYAIRILSDNKILVAGTTWNDAGGTGYDFALTRLLEDGTVDGTFGTGGWAVTNIGTGTVIDEARALTVNTLDGTIIVAGFGNNGTDRDFAVVRYSANGVIDGGFGTGGVVMTDINANDMAEGVAVQTDGKIVAGGTSNVNGFADYTVVRYNSDGTLDAAGFGTGGIATVDIAFNGANSTDLGHALALQADGKILLTGQSQPNAGGNNNVATLRLTTAGVLDVTFNPLATTNPVPGIVMFNYGPTNTDEGAFSIAMQSDGKIVVGGNTNGAGSSFALLLLRYNSDGTPDNTFDGDGIATANLTVDNEFAAAINLFGNRIYFAGSTGPNFNKDIILAAFQNDGTPLPLVLSQFYAQKQSSKVVLQWQTASEEGVKQFVIERSNDGKTFKAIGTVAAAGNSTITQKYSFADQSPFTSTSNYYRLLMQDADGNFKYSKMLIIKFDGQLSTEMKVYPSMVKDILQVQLPDGMNGNIGIQIIDMNGRIIKRNNIAGDGSALNTTMDVSTLIKGVYIIKATTGNTSVISRFTKQ